MTKIASFAHVRWGRAFTTPWLFSARLGHTNSERSVLRLCWVLPMITKVISNVFQPVCVRGRVWRHPLFRHLALVTYCFLETSFTVAQSMHSRSCSSKPANAEDRLHDPQGYIKAPH